MTCSKTFTYIMILVFFFATGGMMPVLNSVVLRTKWAYKYGLTLKFQKPFFSTFAMFLGMSIFSVQFLITFIKSKCKKTKKRETESHSEQTVSSMASMDAVNAVQLETTPRNSKKNEINDESVFSWIVFRDVCLPSIMHLAASILQTYSLMYMPTTVWQVFHGFQVLFTTLFAVTYLKQQLFLVDWLGLFINVSGICFTGVAGLLRGIKKSDDSISTIFLMFILSILSHGIKSLQTVLEEKILKTHNLASVKLISYEGLWGLYFMLLIVMPAVFALPVSNPLYEDVIETGVELTYSRGLIITFLSYTVVVTLFTFAGVLVTSHSTAIHRNMYETLRPLAVWVLSVMFQYVMDKADIDEEIDKYTILELIGFAVSVVGSLIYNRVWRCGCFIYSDINNDADASRELLTESLITVNTA